jgi:tetratricopeptide (TPR) repeat protein
MRRIFLLALSLMVLVLWGCHKKSSVPVPLPAPVATAPPEESAPPAVSPPVITPPQPVPLEPAPLPKSIAKVSNLDLGEKHFRAGNYLQAARAYEAYLKSNPKSNNRDLALFHLGLSRALSSGPSQDLRQAEVALKRLVAEFPKSQYKSQAEFILGLQAQIEKLNMDVQERDERIKRISEELQKLKEIDMQRRPSRPASGQ